MDNYQLHIAPCGMNCSLCSSFQREKDRCLGCNINISNNSTRCSIVHCAKRVGIESGFCHECAKFPCKRMLTLDARYRQNYGMSMIDNLEKIKDKGMEQFKQSEITRWTCSTCGSLLCVHKPKCLHCRAINGKYCRKKRSEI